MHLVLIYFAVVIFANAQQSVEHPVPLPANADTAQCVECHAEKQQGKHVHTAISLGCTTCHNVETKNDSTTIRLTAPPEELCFTCHEKSKQATLHGPYEKGGCLLCHDAHASDNDKQLRAAGNQLCLECHRNRPISGKVALFKTAHELSESEFQEIPKIDLDPTLKFGHPMGAHKVADAPNPLQPGEKMSCLTCHENHGAEREKLIRMAEYQGKQMDVCDACHLARDEASMAEAQKRADALELQRQNEEKMRTKQAPAGPQRPPRPPEKNP
ncbi:MAG: hypothetical protein LAN71_06730 [Acidobacteriia bacterium]|nr:hypothetical protein [Terriglobia bacterium]